MANKYIRSYTKLMVIACLFVATCVQAQQFRTSAGTTMATAPQQISGSGYSNPMLQPRSAAPVSLPVTRSRNMPISGKVYSDGIFEGKYTRGPISLGGGGASGGGGSIGGAIGSGSRGKIDGSVKTISSISSYQSISLSNINAPSPQGTGEGNRGPTPPPPPPPTPDPHTDDPAHQLPIGEAWWLMILFAGGYVERKLRKQFQEDR